MFLPIFYCRRLHPWAHFFVRIQQVAECWVPAGEQVRFEHEYGRFANFPAGSQRLTSSRTRRQTCTWRRSWALRAVSKRGNQAHARGIRVHGGVRWRHGEVLSSSTVRLDQERAHGDFVGSTGEQASTKILVVILVALEEPLADDAQPAVFLISAWWLLLQSWGTLRFADHRGLEPHNVPCEGGALIAKLTISKTLGTDEAVSSRLVIVDSEGYFRCRNWVVDGWNLLQPNAPYEKGLPSSSRAEILREVQQGITVRYSIRGANATTVVALLSWVQALQRDFPALLDPSQRSELLTKSCICPRSGDAGQELVRGGK